MLALAAWRLLSLRVAAAAVAVAVVALLLTPVTPTGLASADGGVNHAGVIVRQADGSLVYGYVAFTEEKIDGIELLRRSGIPLVTAGFGGLGAAVCSLDGQGCSMAECRRSVCQGGPNAPYWQYFRQGGPRGWSPLLVGASATAVRDGDIDGWSWTAKEAGLPSLTLPELAALAGADPALSGDEGSGATWRRTGAASPAPGATAAPAAATLLGAGAILTLIGGGAAAAAMRRRAQPETEAA